MPSTDDIWKLLHSKIMNSFSSVKQAFLVFDDVSHCVHACTRLFICKQLDVLLHVVQETDLVNVNMNFKLERKTVIV